MHDEDKLFNVEFMKSIYGSLYCFLESLGPQSSIYFFGLYGGCVFVLFLDFSWSVTTCGFHLSSSVTYAQCLCILIYYATFDVD